MGSSVAKIRFLGRLAELIGREIELDVPVGSSVGEVRREIARAFPDSAEAISSPRVRAIIGDDFVSDQRILATGDELELFPPVSGG